MSFFAFPYGFSTVALSSVLQQLFNSADMAVVGHFAGSAAMAAVGSNAPVINLLVSLFVSMSVGTNVHIATLIGSGQTDRIPMAIRTVVALALLCGLLVFGVGFVFSEGLLNLLHTPTDVLDLALLYLRFYLLGTPFSLLYNFCAAVLRSTGDNKHPLFALLLSGIFNVFLNLIFVANFGWGVIGVAVATVIANFFSAAYMLITLAQCSEPFRLVCSYPLMDTRQLATILYMGIPTGIEGGIFALSNTIIQAAINSFGSLAMAGSSAAFQFECVGYYAINAFNEATVTFISQNYSAGNYKRCKQIYIMDLLFSMLLSSSLNGIVYLNRGFFLGLFSQNEGVLNYAYARFSRVLLFQFLGSVYEISGSVLRGMGFSLLPTGITLLGICAFRIFWVIVIFPAHNTFSWLLLVYSYGFSSGISVLYCFTRKVDSLFICSPCVFDFHVINAPHGFWNAFRKGITGAEILSQGVRRRRQISKPLASFLTTES